MGGGSPFSPIGLIRPLLQQLPTTPIILINPHKIMTNPSTTAVAISSNRENIALVVQQAPQAYISNRDSASKCTAAGQSLIDEIERTGMTPQLDQQAAAYIEKTRRTIKAMNERRAPLTKLFDAIRAEHTALENAINPSTSDSPAARLQQMRNDYAARLRQQEIARQQAEAARQQAEARRKAYRASLDNDYRQQFHAHLTSQIQAIEAMVEAMTVDTYQQVADALGQITTEFDRFWCPTSAVPLPILIPAEEAADIRKASLDELMPKFAEQYQFEMTDMIQSSIDRLPSRLQQLRHIAQASAEEAQAARQQMQQRQAEDKAQREAARLQRQAEEARTTQMQQQAAQAQSLFAQAKSSGASTTRSAKVSRRIEVSDPQGFLAIFSTWWQREGQNLSVEELAKIMKKQLTFCEALANKQGVEVDGIGVSYVEVVKAR